MPQLNQVVILPAHWCLQTKIHHYVYKKISDTENRNRIDDFLSLTYVSFQLLSSNFTAMNKVSAIWGGGIASQAWLASNLLSKRLRHQWHPYLYTSSSPTSPNWYVGRRCRWVRPASAKFWRCFTPAESCHRSNEIWYRTRWYRRRIYLKELYMLRASIRREYICVYPYKCILRDDTYM